MFVEIKKAPTVIVGTLFYHIGILNVTAKSIDNPR